MPLWENLVVNNKDNRVFKSRNYRSDNWKFDVLKTSILFRANICFKNIKFPRGNHQPIVCSGVVWSTKVQRFLVSPKFY